MLSYHHSARPTITQVFNRIQQIIKDTKGELIQGYISQHILFAVENVLSLIISLRIFNMNVSSICLTNQ